MIHNTKSNEVLSEKFPDCLEEFFYENKKK